MALRLKNGHVFVRDHLLPRLLPELRLDLDRAALRDAEVLEVRRLKVRQRVDRHLVLQQHLGVVRERDGREELPQRVSLLLVELLKV